MSSNYMTYLRSVLSTENESSTTTEHSQISQTRKRKSSTPTRSPPKPKQPRSTTSLSRSESEGSLELENQSNPEHVGYGNLPVFQRGENIYSDTNVNIMVRAIEHQRITRFRAEDHLYQVDIIPRRRQTPLLLSLETAIKEALSSILLRLRGNYPSNLHHQVYITIIENNIVHGLNTGNFDLNAPPNNIVNRALTILHSYLKSNQTLHLTNSFKIQIKVLSHNHTNYLQGNNPHFRKKIFRDFSRIRT